MTISLEPMQVLEEGCPFHKDEETHLVAVGGIASWLQSHGYLDANNDPIPAMLESSIRGIDDIKFRIWDERVTEIGDGFDGLLPTEIGQFEYRCRFGCKLFAFALMGGDWAANGLENRSNDLMDFFHDPRNPPPTKEEWEAGR